MNMASKENQTGWGKSFLWLMLAVACFNLAYTSIKFPALGLFIFGYAYFLVRLTNQPSVKRAFYFGLAAGFLCAALQAGFFWEIFKQAAIVLWLVFAFWIGLFTALVCGCIRRWGNARAMWLIPVIWTGLEYFRSELYYLRFSWLNIAYAFPNYPAAPLDVFGMYGVGFLVFSIAAIFAGGNMVKNYRILASNPGYVTPSPASAFHRRRPDGISARERDSKNSQSCAGEKHQCGNFCFE